MSRDQGPRVIFVLHIDEDVDLNSSSAESNW